MELILASKSPRRLTLLQNAGAEPTVRAFETDETITKKLSPEQTVVTLAERKATAAKNALCTDSVILASDTVVALGDELFGKPKDDGDAKRILRLLSGKEQRVLTGVCVVKGDRMLSDFDCTYIRFRELSDSEIDAYVASGESRDKAGAYAVQENGGHFVSEIRGEYDNVVGLPVKLSARLIKELCGLDLYTDFK
ncbi:MAG: Maf family protein [Clostridia bacterium]|nr:Maf family protein [Clostridia bacterium]